MSRLFMGACMHKPSFVASRATKFTTTRSTHRVRTLTTESLATTKLTKLQAIETLRRADAVCFDVDSTVIDEEGIDVLAAYNGAGEAVAELTRKAMGGHVLFQDALAARLELIKPSRKIVESCLADHPLRLTPGVKDFISALHHRGVAVYLVSGGFRQMINPVAELVNVPRHRIYANNLHFASDREGTYAGFDTTEPTSRDGGKPRVLQQLKDAHGYKTMVMIGDGATDMQARPPADLFVGFGGVVVREPVRAGADWFVTDFKELIDALNRHEGKGSSHVVGQATS